MICERCGRNEATFYYRENVNGRERELHLCADCAREEGVGGENIFQGFFRAMPSMWEPFFSPLREERMAYSLPVTQRSRISPAQSEAEEKISGAEDEALRLRREQSILHEQLRDAVEREDYETAARLRDELKRLENK